MTSAENRTTSIDVSGEALRTLASRMRDWSGWPNASLILGKPEVGSPIARCVPGKRQFTINADVLLRNPNRVLNRVTEFRFRQEAILTGVMLHEAAHARFTRWKPRTPEAIAAWTHSDGQPVSVATATLANWLEEARIEALMNKETITGSIPNAKGLGWTMRASTLALLPPTDLSSDPDVQILEILQSFILRAGRAIAREAVSGNGETPTWVRDSWAWTQNEIRTHIDSRRGKGIAEAAKVRHLIREAITWSGVVPDLNIAVHEAPFMIDCARRILEILFPDRPVPPMDSPACGDESPDQGDGDSEGQGSTESAGESDSGAPGGSSDDEDGADGEGEGSEESEERQLLRELTQEALSEQEKKAQREEKKGIEQERAESIGLMGGSDTGHPMGDGWRSPNSDDREQERRASEFLRRLINPTETSRVLVTDTPSALIDGAAKAAWKASGGTRDPRFFRRTVRTVTASPPVKIAVLVDISSSMNVLQEPSSVLSWALANAAVDLRNFAGRGAQIESTLIHWGSHELIVRQSPGSTLPGIYSDKCVQGTTIMHEALRVVEEQIPGFFDAKAEPENRLLVQFTDWAVTPGCADLVQPWIQKVMAAGVNMLSVVPGGWSPRYSMLDRIMTDVTGPGQSRVVRYDKDNPGAVWDAAAALLDGR